MRKIKNILMFIDGEKSVCNYWRGTGVFNEIEKEGHVCTKISNWDESLITLRKYDIAYFQRPMFKDCFQQVMMAKDCGLKIWVDLDDWFELPDNHPVKDVYDKHFALRTFKTILKLADVITVTNERMRVEYLRFSDTDKVKVVPNAINDKLFKQQKQSVNYVIVWRGGGNHVNDIKPEIESIKRFLSVHNEYIFTTIGERLPEFDTIKNHQHIGRLSIHDYFGFMLSLRPVIVIAPLEKNKFNELKSNIVWQEATISGAVCMTPSYSTCVDGVVYYDLFESLDYFAENRKLIDNDFKLSEKILRKKYYLSNINKLRLNIIKSL